TSDALKELRSGTKATVNSFRCILSGAQVPYTYIDDEANAGRMKARLIAVVADIEGRRVYISPNSAHNAAAAAPEVEQFLQQPSRGTFASNAQGRTYGFNTFADYYTKRQLFSLSTIATLIEEV